MSDSEPDVVASEGFPVPGPPIAPGLYRPAPLPDRRAEYEAFIGPRRAPYYVPRFEALDRNTSAGRWNWWPALFTQAWLVLRGMYLWGLLWYPLLTVVVGIVCALLWGVTQDSGRLARALPVGLFVLWLLAPGFFGNQLFHRRAAKVIEQSRQLAPVPGAGAGGLDAETARRDWLMRQGVPGWAGVVVLFPFFFGGCLGLLAAVAIPAYSDYTVRAKVADALHRVESTQARYDAYVTRQGRAPDAMADLNLPETDADYGANVSSVRIGPDHDLLITLVGESRLNNRTLSLVPTGAGSKPPWACHVGTLPARYAPRHCRS